ncbi:MAG: hypothetical protein ACLR6J_12775 [Parabacteroides merdae]
MRLKKGRPPSELLRPPRRSPYDLAGEEEFRRLAHEAVELYIRDRKRGKA